MAYHIVYLVHAQPSEVARRVGASLGGGTSVEIDLPSTKIGLVLEDRGTCAFIYLPLRASALAQGDNYTTQTCAMVEDWLASAFPEQMRVRVDELLIEEWEAAAGADLGATEPDLHQFLLWLEDQDPNHWRDLSDERLER